MKMIFIKNRMSFLFLKRILNWKNKFKNWGKKFKNWKLIIIDWKLKCKKLMLMIILY